MSKNLVQCECGCGGEGFFNQMTEIVVEEAIDRTMRQTVTSKRFLVLPKCKKPFEEELGMKLILQHLVVAWVPKTKTLSQRLNLPLTFYNWCRRIAVARQVIRLQQAIHERNYGFEYAKVRAINSGVLFGAPRFMQGFLARRFTARLRKATLRISRPCKT